MTGIRTPKARRAMSLVELLLALVVSSILLGAASATYLTATRAWETGRVQGRNSQTARAALEVMARAIEAAVPPDSDSGAAFTGTSGVIEGTELNADRLVLTTTGWRHTPERPGTTDLAAVEFYLDISDLTGEPALLMRHKPFPYEDEELKGSVEEIAPNVTSFNVRYFDGTEFLDEWEDESLPAAVRVDLTLYDFQAEENAVGFSRLVEVRLR